MMKNKNSFFSVKNSTKLFIGVFVSVISVFALVYFVQNPLYKPASEAAGTYSYTLRVYPTVKKTACNAKIASYVLYSQFYSTTNTNIYLGSTKYSFSRLSPPASFVTGLRSGFYVVGFAKQTVTAYDAKGTKIGNSLSVGASSGIPANGTTARYLSVPCSGF